MAKQRKKSIRKPIEQYEHNGKGRLNNPPVGLVDVHIEDGRAIFCSTIMYKSFKRR